MKYALIRKGLEQRQKIASQPDGNLHSVAVDAVLLEGAQEFHHGAVIPRIAGHIHGKSIKVLHNMGLTILFQFLQNLKLAHIEDIVGIGGFMLLGYPQNVVGIVRAVS